MGKKGGSETQTIELPPEIREAAIQNLDIANEVASIGAMPYRGPAIAGFSPMQQSAMQGVDQAASAFGMPSNVDWQQGRQGQMRAPRGMSQNDMLTALTGMPPPNAQAGGFSGYSGAPIADQQMAALPEAQRRLLESFTINPETGAGPTNPSVPIPRSQSEGFRGSPKARETVRRRMRERRERERRFGSKKSGSNGDFGGR